MKAIIRRLCEGHHAVEIQLFKQRRPSRSPQYNLSRPRALAYYSHNPFPFLKLPGELRNEVYKLASSSTDRLLLRRYQAPHERHTEGISCYASLQNIMIHSSLYRTCKERRFEGRVSFHQFHHFMLSVEHGGCLPAILSLASEHWRLFLPALGRSRQERDLLRYWKRRRVHICDDMFITELPLDTPQVITSHIFLTLRRLKIFLIIDLRLSHND